MLIYWASSAQVKNEFENRLTKDHDKNVFSRKLLTLDSIAIKGINAINVDSLKATGEYNFLDKKESATGIILVFDIIPLWAEAYNQLARAGKIEHLEALRKSGKLKLTSRSIANEVELPVKTDKHQTYNDFYLHSIKDLMQANKAVLKADNLDFATYQSWERDAKLPTDIAIREYRESFIRFLYETYHFK
jgi:antitoxin component of RelBE/YafQ-DinJ toxin-antitoxin module